MTHKLDILESPVYKKRPCELWGHFQNINRSFLSSWKLKHSFTISRSISISSVEIQGERVKYNMDVEDVGNIYGGGQYRIE